MFFPKCSTWVDVGGTGDCGFRALAAGMIDDFLDKDTHVDDWNYALKQFFAYYDSHSTQKNIFPNEYQDLTPAQRMQFLIKQHKQNMPALLVLVAFNLRQIAVNQIVADPYRYRGAFVDMHENTSIEEMRKPHTHIDETAILAVADALKIQIKLSLVTHNKELPLTLKYNQEAKKSVKIQCMNHHYKPKLKNPALFQSTHKLINTAQNLPIVDHQDPDMATNLAKIAAGLKKDQAIYDETFDTLVILVADGKLTKADLLHFYVSHLAANDYFQGYRGLEQGSQGFFEKVLKHQASSNFNEQITRELIHAFAKASANGHICLDSLIDGKLESKKSLMAG